MNRRDFGRLLLAWPAMLSGCARRGRHGPALEPATRRVRPRDPGWPAPSTWESLRRQVGGRLVHVESPVARCGSTPPNDDCHELVRRLRNPYYIGDQPGLTQTAGWLDAWTSAPSVYAVAAESTRDVVAAVDFAREHNLRLVIKGGGHSYQGTSSAPDSLLIWTRPMSRVTLHDSFVATGCQTAPQAAVTIEAGATWMNVYDAVSVRGGRYVQGGGCATVGVAGLVQSGGFGSFSKRFGLAAAGLLEAEVVTADGVVRVANRCTHPDLFWGIKGGGGGSLGVVTRVTLQTHELPEYFGGAFGEIRAASDQAYRELVARLISFYRERLFNPTWGEQLVFGPGNTVRIAMVFQGIDQSAAEGVWEPLRSWLAGSPHDFSVAQPLTIVAVPARRFWDAAFLRQNAPALIASDDRPGAKPTNVFWTGDEGEVGQYLHAYHSAWMPASLLDSAGQHRLVDALFASTRHWRVSLHFNKGLAGAPRSVIAEALDTAMNPAVVDAFALAIVAGAGPPAYAGLPTRAESLDVARRNRLAIRRAFDELRNVAPGGGSYVSESDYFEPNWAASFWGSNRDRLAAVKSRYDRAGLFFVHHGVGSDQWSDDGFSRR